MLDSYLVCMTTICPSGLLYRIQCNSSSNRLPIGYSVILALTGLPIGYSVIVALTGLPIVYSVIKALTGLKQK